MKYLKKFNTESEYNSFKDSDAFIEPNVSHIKENHSVEYNSNKPKQITYQFDLRDASWEFVADMFYHHQIVYGDFSELYDSLVSFTRKYGTVQNYDTTTIYTIGQYDDITPLANPKITVLTYDRLTNEPKTYNLCWMEIYCPEDGREDFYLGFDTPRGPHNSGGECFLTRDDFEVIDGKMG